MRNTLVTSAVIVITILSLVGCSSGGSDSTTSSENTLTGTIIDAPVQGLGYSTATQSGFTDENGNFKYKSAEYVTFKLGTLDLGTVLANATITPLTLAGDTSLGSISTKAKNIAMLLQNLDQNRSDTSKITLSSALKDHNFSGYDLNNTNLEASMSVLLGTVSGSIDQINNTVITQESANTAMSNYLKTYFAGTYTGKVTVIENYIPGFSCYNYDNYSVNIASNGNDFNITSPVNINGTERNVIHTTSALESSTLDFVHAASPINDYALKMEITKFDGKTMTGYYYLKNDSVGTLCKGKYSLEKL